MKRSYDFMKNTIFQTPVCQLKELNNLFIELTEKNCNQHCRHCYIDFPLNKNVKDFISIDAVKEALIDTKKENIECIYLTGAEPMTHPDFNSILRACLKRSNVCIFTNGTFINEKKVRFLKRVEEESSYEIIFKLSIDHFDEIKNDLSKIKKNVLSEDDSATEKLEISVKNLSQRIDVQEAKIDSVDDKLNKIITQQNESKELKSLLEYVASQVSVTNEKIIENDKLSQKIASMEKQLKKIEKNLAVITEYIDEEDAQDDEFYSDEPVN